MRSSTSSSDHASDHGFTERHVPAKPWLGMMAIMLVAVVAGFGAWELELRARGYGPTCADSPNLWSEQRELARGVGPEQIVFTGASRGLFDMDLEVFREA